MPLRSLTSSVFAWPDRDLVVREARRWAEEQRRARPNLVRFGFFGSYARGDWGPGSDLDIVAIVRESETPFAERPLAWDLMPLPVPAEILVYTEEEWARMHAEGGAFARRLADQTVWF